MSGVRAHNEELTQLGMELPGFVERQRVISTLPSLSLLTLAGMTPDRFDIEYHDIEDLREVDELPECDLAAISSYTAQIKDAYEIARRYRRKGTKTVMGGLHVTALPEEASQHCDAVVVGEGELSWLKVLEDFENGRLQSLYKPNGGSFDLADSAVPRYDLLDPEKYNRLTVQTQRGCPWRCSFCASSILLTHNYKVKPVEKVMQELAAIKDVWPRPFVEFADDNTFVNKKHSKKLMQAMEGAGIRWFTETDVSVAEDAELLQLMHSAGCKQVLIGFESPNAKALSGIEERTDWKMRQRDKYLSAIECIQSHRIAVIGCFVLGLDGDTPEIFDEIAQFVEESGLFQVQITVMTPFPGTPLYSRLKQEGRLFDDTAWEKCTLFDVNFEPNLMSVGDLEQGLITLGTHLYSEEQKHARASAFKNQFRRALAT